MKSALSVVLLLAIFTQSGLAQEAKKEKPNREEQNKKVMEEVQGLYKQWQAAFNAKDAAALSKLYNVKTDVLFDDDVRRRSRKEMAKYFREEFKNKPNVKQTLTEVEYQILSPRIVVETGVWQNMGGTDESAPSGGRYAAIWAKKKGKWVIVHDRGWPVSTEK